MKYKSKYGAMQKMHRNERIKCNGWSNTRHDG